MDQSIDATKQINETCSLLNNGDNDQAFIMLSKLKDAGKIQFQISKSQMQNQVENAEQQIIQAKWAVKCSLYNEFWASWRARHNWVWK